RSPGGIQTLILRLRCKPLAPARECIVANEKGLPEGSPVGHAMGESATVAVRVAGQLLPDAVPGIADGPLGLRPAQLRVATGALPAALEFGFRLRRPRRVGARGAGLGTVAVGRAVIVEAVVRAVVIGLVEVLRVVLVSLLVGAIGAVRAVVG